MSKILRLTTKYTSRLISKSKKCFNQGNMRYISSVIFQKHSKTSKNKLINKKFLLPSNKLSIKYFSTTVNVPNMGDSISEGTLVEWSKNIGDQCEVDDIICVIETDKVSIDVRTDFKGVLTEQLANIDDTLEVGAPLFIIDESKTGNVPKNDTQEPPKSEPVTQPKQESKPEPVKVTSPTTEMKSTESKPTNVDNKKEEKIPPPPPPILSDVKPMNIRSENVVAMTRIRQKIASRLKEAQNTAASLTTFNEIDMSNIINLRNKYKEDFEKKHGVKLGFMSAFVSASTKALLKYPAVNAYISETGKEIIYHDYCDVSVAVASPTGLVVPVLRNTESMSFADIEKEIQRYAGKAKNGTLSIEDMSGGTFTISNGGVFGSLMGTPIINPPQSAILGMHGTFQRPVAVNNEVKIRPMMYIALTYDHRIVDGREAVMFLRTIKDNVEDPARLIFDI